MVATPLRKRGSEVNTKIDMTGTWFVSYGIFGKIEGCNTITIEGNIDKSEIIDHITDAIVSGFDDDTKKIVRKHGPLIVRSITRLSPLQEEGGAK
jgi:hypothetical protein